MKAVLQRVKQAKVNIKGQVVAQINAGLLVLLGVDSQDTAADIDYLAEKIVSLRIFDDAQGKINLALHDVNAEILVVSQFTLLADCQKGRRPSFDNAAKPVLAQKLYEEFIKKLKQKDIAVKQGRFQEVMDVELINHGPMTIILDSKGRCK